MRNTLRSIVGLVAVCVCAGSSMAAAEKSWHWDTEGGYVQTAGNSVSVSANAATEYKNSWERFVLTVKGALVSASQNDVQSAESYSTSAKGDSLITQALYMYEFIGWEKDRFAGIENRYRGQAGAGYKFFKQKADELDGELGIDYTSEDYTIGGSDDFASGRVYGKYQHSFSPTASFLQDAEGLFDFDNSKNIRLNTVSAITASLTTKLALKFSLTLKYDNVPVEGFKKTDTIFASNLIVKL